MYPLLRFPRAHGEGGPQTRMAIDERLKRSVQRWDIELRSNSRGEADVVDHTLRRQLREKPNPLLIVGQWIERLGRARLLPKEIGKQCTFFRRGEAGDSS